MSRIVTVGFTGTQEGMTDLQLEKVAAALETYWLLGATRFRHGDCVGADEQAHELARRLGYKVSIHPPIVESRRAFCQADEVFKPREFLARNKDIVLFSDVLIATPKGPEELRSGTWSTVRFARSRKLPYLVLDPRQSDTTTLDNPLSVVPR